MSVAIATSWVRDFAEGSRDMRDLLGGKGANVAEMTRILGADRVPAGFTITTEACVAYLGAGHVEPEGLDDQVDEALSRLEDSASRRLGDPEDPLLVSVRSGARVSMPGMLDTVLNLGLNDASVDGLAARTGDPRFAWDSYRRFLQMFGNVVRAIPGERYEQALAEARRSAGVRFDSELGVDDLVALTDRFKAIHVDVVGEDFPADPRVQLRLAIRAVFDSWTGERAVSYRRINGIPDGWGTAVNVQQMVFGNRGPSSATGVAFSRDELTGEPRPSGDFLVCAQGEDVVSGVRNTRELHELADVLPHAHAELMDVLRTLERHYGDMQDVEFTIEEGRLYLLQTRSAKRPAQAAVRFACDAVDEGLLTVEEALLTLDARALEALLHPTFDPRASFDVLVRGVAASPGAAQGAVVFTAADAVAAAEQGRDVILVRPFTEADDVAGFHAARGIVTSEGGKASHAALVARGMGRPCVCGAGDLEIDLVERVARVGDRELREGDRIAIDGTTGVVTTTDVPLVEAQVSDAFERVLGWADEHRRLGVRANVDTPEDARHARELGARGIGLCRTEHMFMAPDRQPRMRAMILAEGEAERRAALDELLPLQQADFEGLFEAMSPDPVTIRLLDPPLHEFLPHGEVPAHLRETNPMLGTRGVRLAMVHPEICEMQAEAIFRAAVAVRERSGHLPSVEVMVPLVQYEGELARMRSLIVAAATRHGLAEGEDYLVGATIELPRSCMVADLLAESAAFLSFGTNDLTQTALGVSRDDAEGRFLGLYLEQRVIDRSPFETIDGPGVGRLVRIAVAQGRAARPALKLGVCGEHGGDPDSIAFFHAAGLDYVSCSPFRVPIARVAAAQAAIQERQT